MQDISDCLSPEAQNVAEARLAAKRAARAEAREIRMKELERQQKEVEERSDKDFGEKGSRPVSSLSAATLASLGGTSSRRGSGETSISVDTEASIREIKDSLAEVEEKYKRSMVTNAQLDNEKSSLQYQVDTLREVLLELEEELAESRRQYEEKHKECERQRHDQNVLRFQLAEMKEAMEQRESLLTKHGIVLDSVGTPNGDASLEPHVNPDGRPDPPIRATSMGPSEEAVEKKETMSVVGEIPPSKPKQDNQEVLLTAPSETPLNAELGDKMKEQTIQAIASNSNDDVDICKPASNLNDELDTGGTFSGCQNLEYQGEGLPIDPESTSDENEIAMDECAPENLITEVLEQDLSEVHREATLEQRESSPVESEVFQDALDNVVQSPCVTSPPSEKLAVSVSDFGNEDYSISKQDFNKEEGKSEVQSTSVECKSDPNNGALEMSECRDNTTVITDDMSDLHSDSKDEQETSSHDSSQYDSGESTADEMTTTAVEHEKVCEEEVKLVESGLQCREDDSIIRDSNANYTTPEKEIVSTETALHTDAHHIDTHDVGEEKKLDITPEQSSQDIQLTKEARQLVDSENNNFGEVTEPCIGRSTQSTVEDEPLRDSEVFEDSISHLDQHEDLAETRSLNADLESPDNGKMNTVFLNAPGTELLDKGEQDTFSGKSEKTHDKTTFSDVPELLHEGRPGKMSDHPVCDMDEKTNPVLPDAPSTELLDEDKNTNDNVPVVAETSKETIPSETFSSDGESTPEGEESDDNEEDVAVRSEKYTGEGLPLGSSVDQASADDIRMEDSLDKASRKGKGKNKEDCVVS